MYASERVRVRVRGQLLARTRTCRHWFRPTLPQNTPWASLPMHGSTPPAPRHPRWFYSRHPHQFLHWGWPCLGREERGTSSPANAEARQKCKKTKIRISDITPRPHQLSGQTRSERRWCAPFTLAGSVSSVSSVSVEHRVLTHDPL